MKTKNTFLAITLVFSLALFPGKSIAQDDALDFLDFGLKDANTLMSNYFSPLVNAMGVNMNQGWYNTAQAHRLGRFDIRFGIPVSFVPQSAQTFIFNERDYEYLTNPTGNQPATIFGDSNNETKVRAGSTELTLPGGSGFSSFPAVPPQLQVHVGLIRDTELMFRFIPGFNVGDFSTGLFGFGFKHGVKQYIPVVQAMPFDLALVFGYSSFTSSFKFTTEAAGVSGKGQSLEHNVKGWNLNLVASKKITVITVHGGVRYMRSNGTIKLLGEYEFSEPNSGETYTEIDPFDIRPDGFGQIGLSGGLRLKLGFFSLFADATLSRYSSANFGLSLGFHN